jgi:hypothetical protein
MSPQTGLSAAVFGKEVVSVAPDDHVRSQPSKSVWLPYLIPLLTTTLHFSPHIKDVWPQVKQNRGDF